MIVKGRTLDRDVDLRCEVCVIGSGAGGAVVARELAGVGRDVVVLEQGGYYTKADFTQREDEMMPLLYEDMGQRATDDGSVIILQGRNVGGSTVHNLCYSFRTPAPILDRWAREDGVREMRYADLEPSFERVEAMLKVKQIRPDEVNVLNDKIRQGCEKLGYRGFVTRHNRENCLRSGFCLLGCSYDAKQSMLVTYVPAASEAGARIYADCQVTGLTTANGRVKSVEATVVDADRRPRFGMRVEADVVVVSAGAINTPQLLLNSRVPNRNRQIGRNLHLHPSVLMAGFYDEDVHGYRGIPQSFYVDHFIDLEKDPDRGYILMPVFGYPIATGAQLPGFGAEHAAMMREYHRMVAILVLLHDQSAGTVTVDRSGRPRIQYGLTADDEAQILEGMEHCAEILFASGARRVLAPYEVPLWLGPNDDLGAIRSRGLRPNEVQIASTHPQSTCRMGEDPRRAVVNSWGRSHEVPNLFVADMSVFPTSLGAPPQITTAALGDRTAHYIAAEWPRLKG
ncbi:GMC family oxidoreductase [Candidatus Binatia bacterium]|nr:GMC family oxidoreductase [Candidatus Binatia bacterium]